MLTTQPRVTADTATLEYNYLSLILCFHKNNFFCTTPCLFKRCSRRSFNGSARPT